MRGKIELETLLRNLYKEDLVSIAKEHNLDTIGGKKELIQRLVPEIKPDEELVSKYFGIEQLREILEQHGLPKSGNKEELVQRLLTAIDVSRMEIDKPKIKGKIKEKTPVKSLTSLADEVTSYLSDYTLGAISLRDEGDLERYLYGVLEGYFKGKNAKIISQYIGVESSSNPDIVVEKDGETCVIELKYIRGKGDFDKGVGQAIRYLSIKDGARVILFCHDPQKKIRQEISSSIPRVSIIIK